MEEKKGDGAKLGKNLVNWNYTNTPEIKKKCTIGDCPKDRQILKLFIPVVEA